MNENLTTERPTFVTHLECAMHGRPLRGGHAAQSLQGRKAAAGALRPRRREEGADQGRAERAPGRSVEMARASARAQGRKHRQPRRGCDAADFAAEAREEARRRRDHREGRRPPADRLVQGARPRDGGVDGEGARRQAHGDADQRQCRRGARRLREPLRHPHHHLLSGGYARDQSLRDRARRRARLSRQRADRRLRQAGGAGQGGGRLVRHLDLEGAVPDRGQEDDGARTCRAVRLGRARRDLLSDRRRHRPDRHVEGLRRA